MNDFIKTGVEIWASIKDINKNPATTIKELSDKCFDKRILEKWVSLDWLKEQIENKIGFLKVGCDNKEDKIIQLEWVLSILEVK